MINTPKLKARMLEAGYTQRALAAAMDMSVNTLNEKINGKTEFNISQVLQLCQILHIEGDQEKCHIFLAESSQK